MVAVLTPTSPHRSVAADRHARPVFRGSALRQGAFDAPAFDAPVVVGRPALRVIEGGRAPRRAAVPGQPSAGVFLRRRIVVGTLAVLVLVVLVVGVQVAASLLAAPAPATPTAALAAASPIAAESYVVRPGDTLWSIASRIDPTGDPRPLVDALRDRAGSAALEAGQRIDVSGLGT